MPDLNGSSKLPRSHVLARQRAAPIPEPRATPMAPDDAKPEELFAAGKAQHNEPEPPEDLNSDSQGDDSPGDDPAQQEAPEFETRWENLPPVDGQQLMADLEAFAGQYLAFPSRHCLVAVCLWIVHTWALFAFYVTPRLIFDSPEPSCGKTRVLEVLALLCRGGKVTMSTTVAALYRRIAQAGDRPPTILQDEADVVFGKTTTLRGRIVPCSGIGAQTQSARGVRVRGIHARIPATI